MAIACIKKKKKSYETIYFDLYYKTSTGDVKKEHVNESHYSKCNVGSQLYTLIAMLWLKAASSFQFVKCCKNLLTIAAIAICQFGMKKKKKKKETDKMLNEAKHV